MKIEEVIHVMAYVSEVLEIEGVRQDAAELREAMKALEQHHKDLMGLVEGWKEISDKLPRLSPVGLTLRKVSKQLSSLINPKD